MLTSPEQLGGNTLHLAPVPILAVDSTLRTTYWNAAAMRAFGYSAEDAIGAPLPTVSADALDALSREIFGGAGVERTLKAHWNTRTGERVRVSLRASLTPGSPDSPAGAILVCTEIEPAERAPADLNPYAIVSAAMTDVVSVHDSDGRTLYVSPSVARLTGDQAEDLIGENLCDLVHPQDRDRVRERVIACWNGAEDVKFEWRRVAADGSHLWCETAIRMEPARDGMGPRLVCSTRDASEKRKAESALRKSNKRLSNVLESIEEAFFVIDRDWRFVFANARAETLTRSAKGSLVGKRLQELHPVVQSTRGFEAIELAMSKQKAATVEEFIAPGRIWIRTQVFPSQEGVAIYVQDITREREAQRALNESLSQLKRSITSIAEAMAFAVEIRDPFTAGHQKRVAALSVAMARTLGFPQADLEAIRMGSLLHDIGKIALPVEILCKPGRLSAPEFAIIKTHAQVGYDILKGIAFDGHVALIALQHHERMDGSGYPEGRVGDETVPQARIVAIADVVEAMASHRPYRPALGIEAALEEIVRGRGEKFDAAFVDACLGALSGYAYDLEQLIEAENSMVPTQQETEAQ